MLREQYILAMYQKALEAVEKVDLHHDGHELFRIAKLKDESGQWK